MTLLLLFVLQGRWLSLIGFKHQNNIKNKNNHYSHDFHEASILSSVDFVAQFGTGHRLNRLLSVANFVAERLGFGLRTFWGFCRVPSNNSNSNSTFTFRDVEIFSHLFGTQPLRDLTQVRSKHHNVFFVNKIRQGFYYLHRRDLQQQHQGRRHRQRQQQHGDHRHQPNTPAPAPALSSNSISMRMIIDTTTTTVTTTTTATNTTTTVTTFTSNNNNVNKTCSCRDSLAVQAKLQADVQLYRTLRQRFLSSSSMMPADAARRVPYMRDRYFDKACWVIGLHVRAGNGETRDFERKHQFIDMNVTEWGERVAHHVRSLLLQFQQFQQFQHQHPWGTTSHHGDDPDDDDESHYEVTTGRRRPRRRRCSNIHPSSHNLLFLATDTPSMIPMFQTLLDNRPHQHSTRRDHSNQHHRINSSSSALPIRVVQLHQHRKANGSGLWLGDEDYHERQGHPCLTTWEDSLCDMILLSFADVVVASRLSSYTQTLPMSLVFAKRQEQISKLLQEQEDTRTRVMTMTMPTLSTNNNNQPSIPPAYCEMNRDASSMQCFSSIIDWCCQGTSTWGSDSIELPKDDFFHVSYYNVTPRPRNASSACHPKTETYSCLPLGYT